MAEGQAFLEEEGLIDQEGGLDLDAMVGTLTQISLMTDMLAKVSHMIRSVMLILVQMKLESVGEAMFSAMETRLEDMVAKATESAASSLRMLVNTMAAEIKAATANMATSAMQIAVSASSYWDALKSTPGPGNGGDTMDVRLRAREGVKARQLLINARALGLGLLPGTSNVGWQMPPTT